MKAIIFPVVLGLSAAGGVVGADFAKTALSPGGDTQTAKAGGEYEKSGKASDGKSADKKGGAGDKAAYDGDIEFIKFKRQFVVPVLSNDEVDALILLNIGLEVPASQRDEMFRFEPRFRDAFIRELLQLSDLGYFDAELTSPDTYEVLRETMLRAAHDISKEGVKDVLILDLSRQDR